jgi:hypothetical protein
MGMVQWSWALRGFHSRRVDSALINYWAHDRCAHPGGVKFEASTFSIAVLPPLPSIRRYFPLRYFT